MFQVALSECGHILRTAYKLFCIKTDELRTGENYISSSQTKIKFFLKLFIPRTDRTLPNCIKILYVIWWCDVRTGRHNSLRNEFFYALFCTATTRHLLLAPCTSVFEPYTTVISPYIWWINSGSKQWPYTETRTETCFYNLIVFISSQIKLTKTRQMA